MSATTHLFAEDAATIKDRLHKADDGSALDASALKPWHLIATFQLFDAKGQPTETGTIEEWWASPKRHKVIYSSPSYTNTEIENERGLFKKQSTLYTPEMLEIIRSQIVHPMPAEAEVDDAKLDLRKQAFGKVTLDCVMLTQPIQNVAYAPFGLFPTYCLDHDKTSLRASYNYGTTFIARNNMGRFQGQDVAIDQTVTVANLPAIKGHVQVLTGMVVLPSTFEPSADMAEIEANPVGISEAVSTGNIASKINPIYPERAKQNHVSGTVSFKALIGVDGHIHSLKLVSTPDADLALASFAAVRQWTYRPYLLNGTPVNVNTTIRVNFSFSSH